MITDDGYQTSVNSDKNDRTRNIPTHYEHESEEVDEKIVIPDEVEV
jgi:hypothetical protein